MGCSTLKFASASMIAPNIATISNPGPTPTTTFGSRNCLVVRAPLNESTSEYQLEYRYKSKRPPVVMIDPIDCELEFDTNGITGNSLLPTRRVASSKSNTFCDLMKLPQAVAPKMNRV